MLIEFVPIFEKSIVALSEIGSKPEEVWGFNVIFGKPHEEWIEYTALINIKPNFNPDMYIRDETLRDTIKKIVNSKIV